MKQLGNIILVTNTVDEIYEVFLEAFPELESQVLAWTLWRRCDDQFRGIRVRLRDGRTVLFRLVKEGDEPYRLFWKITPPIFVPAPEKAE